MKKMTGSNVMYKNITIEDFKSFYSGRLPNGTVQGYSFFIDGDIVAIAGVERNKGILYAFSDIYKDAALEKMTIYRGALIVREFLKKFKTDIYARANADISGARSFLSHIGFREVDDMYVMVLE